MPLKSAAVLSIVFAACNSGVRSTSPEPQGQAEHVKPPLEGAKIIGIVFRLAGEGEEVPPNGGVVYLEDAPKDPGEAQTESITIDKRTFSPAIGVVTVGGTVTFSNHDTLPHHVFSREPTSWDTGVLKDGETTTRRFDAVGPVALLCNIHPEMLGWVYVIPGTHFGRIGTDGRYIIGNVRAGTHRVTAWTPRIAPVTQSVTVGASGAVTANFTLGK